MSKFQSRAEDRDELAADRDEDAEQRDVAACNRDDAAVEREADAESRDEESRHDSDDLDRLFWWIRDQVRAHLARVAVITIDPDDWPDLTPAAIAHLRAHVGEQRRLAEHACDAVISLLDELRDKVHHDEAERLDAALDRHAAARDRDDSACDRQSAAQDRELSARDRGAAAVEREQIDAIDVAHADRLSRQAQLGAPGARAVAESLQRIADSRDRLSRSRRRSY